MFLLKAQVRRSRMLVGSSHATSGRSRTRSRRPSATSKRTWRRRAAGRGAEAVGGEGGAGGGEGAGAGGAGDGGPPPSVWAFTGAVPPGFRRSGRVTPAASETAGSGPSQLHRRKRR